MRQKRLRRKMPGKARRSGVFSMQMGQGVGKSTQVGGRHGAYPVEVRVYQDIAAIEQDTRVIGNGQIRNLGGLHLRIEVKRECAISSARIQKAGGFDLHFSIVAAVSCQLYIGKPVFLEHGGIGRRSHCGIGAGLYAALALLPSIERWRKNALALLAGSTGFSTGLGGPAILLQ